GLSALGRRIGELGAPEAAGVLHRVALRLQRLPVQLAEDVLLGEVLVADDDRGLRLRLRGSDSRRPTQDDRDAQRDRECRLRGTPRVLADHAVLLLPHWLAGLQPTARGLVW